MREGLSRYPNMDRDITWFGLLVFFVLAVGALVFYKERALLIDNGFQVFLMISDQRMEIMAQRWPALINRLLPFLFIKMEAPLTVVLKVFSLSYVLVQFCIFILLTKTLKTPRLGLLQIVVLIAVTCDGFYWCNSEQILGLSLVILLLAVFENSYITGKREIAILSALGIIILFTHPLLLIPLTFILVCDQVLKGKINVRKTVFLAIFLVTWFLKKSFLPNWYDSMKSREFNNNLDRYINSLWDIPSLQMFTSDLISKYYVLLLGLVLILTLCLLRRKYLLLLMTSAGIMLYVLIIHIGEPSIEFPFYVEINYYGLVLVIFYFVFQLFESWSKYLVPLRVFVVAFAIISFVRISHFSQNWSNRLAWTENQLQETVCDKLLIGESEIPESIKFFTWSFPYESLLIGSLENKDKSIHVLPGKSLNELNQDTFHTVLRDLPAEYFENVYFTFPQGPYCQP